jgi:diguanylate cyclase (GGDEF)-like protein
MDGRAGRWQDRRVRTGSRGRPEEVTVGRISSRVALDLLLDLTRRLTEERTLEEALQEVTNAALRLLPGEHSSVRILDDSRTRLLSAARSGAGTSRRPASFRPGEGVAGWVVEHGEIARINDTARDARFTRKAGQGFRIRSMLGVPLWSAGRVIGVLALTSAKAGTFGLRDEELAMLLANCAVPPIERARLERLAVTDQHTMAYNRRYLLPCLREEIEAARRYVTPLSVMLLDLDRFKRVNDRHGHAAGDQVLRTFVDRVWLTTRRQDALIRRGGDEFVLVMPGTSLVQATAAAERIRRTVSAAPFEVGEGVHVAQTVSIGLADWDGREEPEAFEARTDRALYAAKRAGRNRVRVAKTPRGAREGVSSGAKPRRRRRAGGSCGSRRRRRARGR